MHCNACFKAKEQRSAVTHVGCDPDRQTDPRPAGIFPAFERAAVAGERSEPEEVWTPTDPKRRRTDLYTSDAPGGKCVTNTLQGRC